MEFIDTHCHLDSILERLEVPDFPSFKSRYLSGYLSPSPDAAGSSPRFGGCITISCDPDSVGPALALMEQDGVYGAFGIHPHDAKAYGPELEARLQAAQGHPKALAWGEIGLDYFYDHSPRELQQQVFLKQMELARAAKLPIVIHCRPSAGSDGAWGDCLDLLEQHWKASGLGGIRPAFPPRDCGYHLEGRAPLREERPGDG